MYVLFYFDAWYVPVSALMDLYTATNGTHWSNNTNWLSGDPCINSWALVLCTGGLITETYAREREGERETRSRSCNLHSHQVLITLDDMNSRFADRDLSNNQLSGTIPSTIGLLIDLRYLYDCHLNLESLSLSLSLLCMLLIYTRALKLTCFLLSTWIIVHLPTRLLNSNQLSGTIPSTIGSLTNLQALYDYPSYSTRVSLEL